MEELREQSELLLSGAWMSMSKNGRSKLIRDFCVGYILPPLSQWLSTTYRARINDGDKLFDSRDELWAPPTNVINRAGRLNKPGESILYLSGQPFAAIFETKAEVGQIVSILACRPRTGSAPLAVAPVAMLQLKAAPHLGQFNRLTREGPLGNPTFSEMLEREGAVDQWKLQDQTVGKLLSTDAVPPDDQDLYDLTIGVRDHLYATFPDYDGVTYPSIATGLTTPNTAVERKRWDDIEPVEVWVAEVSWDMLAGYHKDFGPISTKPLIGHGTVMEDGVINYSSKSKTFMTAWSEFKERHGSTKGPLAGNEPMLVKPWVRRRLSYGRDPNRVVFDF
jgi:hypothetical protein